MMIFYGYWVVWWLSLVAFFQRIKIQIAKFDGKEGTARDL